MPRYRNITTQAVITTTCVVTGGDWEEVDEPAKETKIPVEEDDLEDAEDDDLEDLEEIEPQEKEEPEETVIATPAKPTSENTGKTASRKGTGKAVKKSGGK